MTLEETIRRIRSVDQKAKEDAKAHWDGLGKPLGSLGRLEDVIVQIAGIQRTPQIHIEKTRKRVISGAFSAHLWYTDDEVSRTNVFWYKGAIEYFISQ